MYNETQLCTPSIASSPTDCRTIRFKKKTRYPRGGVLLKNEICRRSGECKNEKITEPVQTSTAALWTVDFGVLGRWHRWGTDLPLQRD